MNGKFIHIDKIIEGLKSNTITINDNGHNIQNWRGLKVKELILELLHQQKIDITEQFNDDTFPQEFLQHQCNTQIGSYIRNIKMECRNCGENIYAFLLDSNTISLFESRSYWALKPTLESIKESGKNISIDIPKCAFEPKEFSRTEIELTSGQFIIKNTFSEARELYDNPLDDRFKQGILPHINYANHLAKLNVGYGQLTNTYFNIWKRSDGEEILLTDTYYYDEDIEKEYEFSKYKGYEYKLIGYIVCDVWRWQAGDNDILKSHNIGIEKFIEDTISTNENGDHAMLKVKPGTWVIDHYFDIQGDDIKDGIWSKLYLKK